MARSHSVVREGIIAGAIGATTVAVWFFIVDLIAGQPLFTPEMLGEGLLRMFGMPRAGDPTLMHVAVYTVFHYAAFGLVGLVVVAVVHQGQRTPGILAGLLILLVVFTIGAYGITGLFLETPLGGLAWYQVFIANLLAAAAMGWWVWKRHPGVGANLRDALEGTDDYPGAENRSAPPPVTGEARAAERR